MTPATKVQTAPGAHEHLDRLTQQVVRIHRGQALSIEARNADTQRAVELAGAEQDARVAAARSGEDAAPALAKIDAERAKLAERKVERAKSNDAARRALVELQEERQACLLEFRPELEALAASAVDDGAAAIRSLRKIAAEIAEARGRIRAASSLAGAAAPAPWGGPTRPGVPSPFRQLAEAVAQFSGSAGE